MNIVLGATMPMGISSVSGKQETLQINYDDRTFMSVSNSANGEVNAETRFAYHQRGNIVWAIYEGGSIAFGTLIAIADPGGKLKMNYQHVSADGRLMTGICTSIPEVLPDGRLRLHETWRWTSGDGSSGSSVVEEIPCLSGKK